MGGGGRGGGGGYNLRQNYDTSVGMRGDTTLLQSRIKLLFTNVTESNLSINFKNFHFQSVTSVKLYLISTVTVNFRIIIKIYLQQANMTIYSLNNTLLFF